MEMAAEQRGQEGRVTEEGEWWGGGGSQERRESGGVEGGVTEEGQWGGGEERRPGRHVSQVPGFKEQVRAFWLSGVSVILSHWGTSSQALPVSTLAKASLAVRGPAE